MAKTTLLYTRRHGYNRLLPTNDPARAVFTGVDPGDPAASRPFTIVDGVHKPVEPKPESLRHFKEAYQTIAVYRSADNRFELNIELMDAEAESELPQSIEIDTPL